MDVHIPNGSKSAEGEEKPALPEGWAVVEVPSPGQSYLLSPGLLGATGHLQGRVKVFSFTMLQSIQTPSPRYPTGRFHEIRKGHFSWVRKTVQVKIC